MIYLMWEVEGRYDRKDVGGTVLTSAACDKEHQKDYVTKGGPTPFSISISTLEVHTK